MAQVARPQEPKKEARPGLTDNYTPAANVLIQGFSELSISERYVAIGLVSLYWDEKVYPVSLRELAAKIQINHTTLRSRAGKRPAEGILDKLWRLGIIGLLEGKPTAETGNKGRVQTYLCVNHRFIAERNSDCTQGKKAKTPRYTVGTTNSSTDETTVGSDNNTVGDTNDTVGSTNHTVVHVSVNVPPKNNKNSKNLEESFPTPEEVSCSQTLSQPTPEKNDDALLQQIAELRRQLAEAKADSSRLQEKHNNQSTSEQPTFQEKKIDFLSDLNNNNVPAAPLTSKQIAAQRKQRMADIMALADKEVGTPLPRSPKTFVQEALDDLVNGDRTDEQIIFSIKDIKARGRDLTFTEIAKNMASAVTKLKNGEQPGKIIAFDPRKQEPQAKVATTPGRKALDEITARQELIRSQPLVEHTRRFAR
jgi:hypothetical protein